MRRVRPYQGPANTPSDEPGVLDTSSECLFESPYRLRRRRFLKAGPARSRADWGPASSPQDDDPPDLGLPEPNMTLIPRVMVRGNQIDTERLRRLSETVEHVLNSLFRKGRLNQLEDPDEYEILAPGFAADRAPGVGDDVTKGAVSGMTWYDRVTRTLYVCHAATEGAADWEAIN